MPQLTVPASTLCAWPAGWGIGMTITLSRRSAGTSCASALPSMRMAASPERNAEVVPSSVALNAS